MNLLTVRDISSLLHVKEKTLYQWAEMGQIPHLKLNGCLRFDLEDIQKWIGKCKKDSHTGYNPLSKLEAHKKGGRS